MTITPESLVATESADPAVFHAIYKALDASATPLIGPAVLRWLVIPMHDDAGTVIGGFWGTTQFEWLHVQLLFVPETLRGRGLGSAMMALAEREARSRGCRNARVETYSFQAAGFYEKLGFTQFAKLEELPPGYSSILLCKHLQPSAGM